MVVDLGTGHGRAVLARAASEPGSFVIGIDAQADAMAEASRRAARGPAGRRLENAWFMVEAAEALPGPLAGVAALVTVTMPWGSLLRGVLGLDPAAMRGIASIVAPGGRIETIVSVIPTDHVDGLGDLGPEAVVRVASAWSDLGFELVSSRPASADDLRPARSSWARRLGDRPITRLELVR